MRFGLGVLTATTGCALRTAAIQETLWEANDNFIGQPASQVRDMRGEPDYKGYLSSGEEVWTYEDMKSGGQPRTEPLAAGDEGVGINDRRLHEQLSRWTEVVSFRIGLDGMVRGLHVGVE